MLSPAKRVPPRTPKIAKSKSSVGWLSAAVGDFQGPVFRPGSAADGGLTWGEIAVEDAFRDAFRRCLRNWTRHRRWWYEQHRPPVSYEVRKAAWNAQRGPRRETPWQYPTPFFLGPRRW